MTNAPRVFRATRAALAFVAALPVALAQPHELARIEVEYEHDSGIVANTTDEPQIVTSFLIDQPGAPWVQLRLDGTELGGDVWAGNGSVLRITSLHDGALQTMNARHLEQWQYRSAYFNGDAVLVEVLAEPHSGENRVVVNGLTIGQPPIPTESQCGTVDDRVPSSDDRICRIVPVGCTGWLIDDCQHCFLTAGHCTLPTFQTVEFNVPLSNPTTGANQHPGPEDQYPIDPASVQSNGGLGTGNDWAYYGVFANSNTGLTPFEAMGSVAFDVIGQSMPPFDAAGTIRITGYGNDFDDNQYDNVQQTHTGPWALFSGNLLRYATDTEGGNSGGPVIHEETGRSIGIHTHAGCNSTGGSNQGTALSHPDVQNVLANPTGICAAGISPQALPTALVPGLPQTINATVNGPTVGTPTMWWRLDGGLYQEQAMTDLGGGLWQATLTAQSCLDVPEFYFSVDVAECGALTSPQGAPTSSYTVLVGTELLDFDADFETDLGWTVLDEPGLSTGTWERAVPVFSDRGDPPTDADGSGTCYVTDNSNDADVDGGITRLTTQAFDLSEGAIVSYSYWVGSTTTTAFGTEDFLQVEVATDAAGTNWTLVRDYRTIDTSWRTDSIGIGTEVAASSTVRLRFSMGDTGGADIVEGGLDAFRISRIECVPGTRYCFGDGTDTACPCENVGTSSTGCDNSIGSGGVGLTAAGDVTSNSVVLEGTGFRPGTNPAVVAIRSPAAESPATVFGDGLLCISTSGLIRLTADLASNGAVSLPIAHGAGAGEFFYQLWYRSNPATFCNPEAFNLSNGLSIVWPQ